MTFGIRRLAIALGLALHASLLVAQDFGPSDYFAPYDPAAADASGDSPEQFVSTDATTMATAAAAGCGPAACGECNCPECQK
jgi:hypothetical protein